MTFPALLHFILTHWWPFVGACVLLQFVGVALEGFGNGAVAIIEALRKQSET